MLGHVVQAILAPLLVFGLVIFVHEFGHFIAAKALGVYAPRFSIGFGPAIFSTRRGETEYVLAWLPIGGYVRMASRHDAEAAFLEGGNEESNARTEADPDYDPNAMIPFGPKPVPEDRWYESKPLWARVTIMIAGVVMNTVLAIVVATGIALHYGVVVYPSSVIGAVRVPATVPQMAQLQAGDSILAVNGHAVRDWDQVGDQVFASAGKLELTTQRGTVEIPLKSDSTVIAIATALIPYLPPVIDTVFPNDRAMQGGLRRGDSITSVGGHPVRSWGEVVEQVSASPEHALEFVVQRASARETLTVTPKAFADLDSLKQGTQHIVGKIGAGAKNPVYRTSVGLGPALRWGLAKTRASAGTVFTILHQIGNGQRSVRELGGPIAITRQAVSAAQVGFDELLGLIVLLSINVAVLNLLPIPILDGGQILINVLESAKGSPFSMRTREYILRFGLVAIALLFVIVMYNDTRAGFASFFGWISRLFGA
jgi:regulator of sigma E protease